MYVLFWDANRPNFLIMNDNMIWPWDSQTCSVCATSFVSNSVFRVKWLWCCERWGRSKKGSAPFPTDEKCGGASCELLQRFLYSGGKQICQIFASCSGLFTKFFSIKFGSLVLKQNKFSVKTLICSLWGIDWISPFGSCVSKSRKIPKN